MPKQFDGLNVRVTQDASVKESKGGTSFDLSRVLFDRKRKPTMTPEDTQAYDEDYSKGDARERKRLKREASDQEQWAKDPRDKVVLAKDNLKGGMDPWGPFRGNDLFDAYVGQGQNPMDRYPAQQTGTDAGTSHQRHDNFTIEGQGGYEEGGHHDAGLSHQKEVSNLTDEEKGKILKNLNFISDKVKAAKWQNNQNYSDDSHFIINYKVIAKCNKSGKRYHDGAYQAYEEIKKAYNNGKYNEWEDRMCEAMGIPKEEQ